MGTIFNNAHEKIKRYDAQTKGQQYNKAYRETLNARAGSRSLVDENGSVSEQSLCIIEHGLRIFEMNRFGKMGDKFRAKLKNKLRRGDIIDALKKFRNLRIESPEWQKYKDDIKNLYNALSTGGKDGLSADEERFDVGATKIMNFIFPELFVMVDRNVGQTLIGLKLIKIPRKGDTYYFCFEKYWEIMKICYAELKQYKKQGDISSLLELDEEPTTLTRIFDKCVFKSKNI